MGVEGLWKLLESTKKTVTLESLQGKVLSVDLSLWIHQAIRGCAGRQNEKNSHLKILYFRICKLLFYGIKPIFVFDGPNVPHFKNLTLSKRRMRRVESSQKMTKIQKKLLKKLAQNVAISKIDEKNSNGQNFDEKTERIPDKFEEKNEIIDFSDEDDIFLEVKSPEKSSSLDNSFDIEDPDFQNLPFDLQNDILLNMRENARFSSKITNLPEDSSQFSSFQMKNLLQKSKINQKLDQLRYNVLISQFDTNNTKDNSEKMLTKVKNIYHGNQRTHILYEIDRGDDNFGSNSTVNFDICPQNDEKFSKIDDKETIFEKENVEESCKSVENIEKSTQEIDFESTLTKNFDTCPQNDEEFLKIDDKEVIFEKKNEDNSCESAKKIEKSTQEIDFISSQPISDQESIDILPNNDVEIPKKASFLEENNFIGVLSADNFTHSNTGNDLLIDSEPVKASSPIFDKISIPESRDQIKSKDQLSNPDENSSSDDDFIEVNDLNVDLSLKLGSNDKNLVDDHNLSSLEMDQEPCCSKILSESPKNSVNNKLSDNFEAWKAKFNDQDDDKSSDNEIVESLEQLRERKRKFEAVDRTMTSEIMEECENLIKLFGLPCIRSDGEAEAQCAHLESQKLTSGTITDDSDVWLFGGKIVYRHVFDKKHYVEKYDSQLIDKNLGLNRSQLIKLAMLTGCDYTEGLASVGVVTGLEILAEFSKFESENDILASLKEFRSFYELEKQKTIDQKPGNVIRSRILNLNIVFPHSFPDFGVYQAFLRPNVKDHVAEKNLEFLPPKIDQLKRFAVSKLGWTLEKIDQILKPALNSYSNFFKNPQNKQLSIKNFTFSLQNDGEMVVEKALDSKKRLTKALEKIKNAKKSINSDKNTEKLINSDKNSHKIDNSDNEKSRDGKISREKVSKKFQNLDSNIKKRPKRACTIRKQSN